MKIRSNERKKNLIMTRTAITEAAIMIILNKDMRATSSTFYSTQKFLKKNRRE